ncbi:EpsG family protein [Luteimonas sp. Y-2-2-4F]|nr:EpsG family protein [Luteimonas sp. Y-2-2-4F]MCD9032756.1 EpsG family protein [Luteimonas sp. Y-2-2-4F]
MTVYWLMFLVPVMALLAPGRLPRRQAWVAWWAVGLLFALLMGLRHEVGGDWFNYLAHFLDSAQLGFADAAARSDPGYYVLNWLVARLGGGIYAVNLACAAVTMWGTVAFCRRQPWPWLALAAAVPYMLIVVGMGYTRQAVALGFALLALSALGQGRTRTFVAWVLLGALFHKSAVLLLPIAALAASRHRLLTVALVAASTVMAYWLLLADSAQALWTNYVEAQYESQGAATRVAMNALPAVLLLLFRRRLVEDPQERRLWWWMAVFALACVPLVGLASTAVDRIALYLIPLQLFVSARVPRLARSARVRTLLALCVLAYYAVVQFVWLHFATHAEYWVPYRFGPLA